MNKTKFNKLISNITTGKKLDKKKIANLIPEDRGEMVKFIVRNRGPVLIDLIPEDFDLSWLHAMGYLYITKGKEYDFIHTSEQSPQ